MTQTALSQSACMTHLQSLLDLAKLRVDTNRRLKLLSKTDVVEKANISTEEPIEEEHLHGYNTSLKNALNHLSDTYSRAWNIGFARNILRALPTELRNMVSKELVQIYKPNLAYDETNRKHTPSYDVGWNASYVPTCHHNERLGPRDYPHYFLKDFMGTEFVTELSENFHSETRFVLDHPYEIKGFLTRDRFFTRCIPLDHVRFMKIVVSLRHFSSITGHIIKWSSPKFDFPLKQHYEAAVRDLAPLKTIPVKRGATIALDVECRSDGGGPKFAEVLFPVVYELKAKGWIVQIKGRYGGRENAMERTTKDFNYNVPRQEWERKARTQSAFASDNKDKATKGNRGTYNRF